MRMSFLSFALLCACLAGCGGSKHKVQGKIVKGGQPYGLSEKGVFQLSFVPAEGKTTQIYNATVNSKDGTFEIVGPDGKGIPAGKYKVQLVAMDPYGGGASGTDKLKGKYAPNSKDAPVVDIGSGELVIDVGK